MLQPVHSVIERSHTARYCAERGRKSRLRQKPGELGTGFGDHADRKISAHNNRADHFAHDPKEILRSARELRDNGANARNTPRRARGVRVAQKDSKKKPLSKKKLEKAAKSELKTHTAKSEKKAAKASKLAAKKATAKKVGTAKQAAPTKKAAPAKKPAPARDVAPAKKVATTRVPRTPAAKPAEPSPTWTVVALRAHAREAGIIGYSRMKKDELLVELRAR